MREKRDAVAGYLRLSGSAPNQRPAAFYAGKTENSWRGVSPAVLEPAPAGFASTKLQRVKR
jgi:hypothetical protein